MFLASSSHPSRLFRFLRNRVKPNLPLGELRRLPNSSVSPSGKIPHAAPAQRDNPRRQMGQDHQHLVLRRHHGRGTAFHQAQVPFAPAPTKSGTKRRGSARAGAEYDRPPTRSPGGRLNREGSRYLKTTLRAVGPTGRKGRYRARISIWPAKQASGAPLAAARRDRQAGMTVITDPSLRFGYPRAPQDPCRRARQFRQTIRRLRGH